MKWYRKLYLGDNAKKEKYKVFGKIRKGRFQVDTFLIILSENPDNLLEIISANMLLQPHYKRPEQQKKIYVVGLCKGYEEALETVRVIIDEVFKNTGGFDLRRYLKFGQSL
jgi:hypothetical protein